MAALRAHAEGLCAREAAVELLVGHQRWLLREDFVEAFVGLGGGVASGEAMAWVDWDGAVVAVDSGRLACSGGEARVLRVAASLAGGVPVDLGDAVGGLDRSTAMLVAAAALHAAGWGDAAVALAAVVGS